MYRPQTRRGSLADLGDAGVPVVDEVLAPSGERQCVVLAQVLLVAHLETDVLDLGDDATRTGELPVGEDVPVDESACLGTASVVRTGDAVVEQTPTFTQLALEELEVRRVVSDADVLGQADGRHCVESGFGDVAVVGETDLGEIGEALVVDGLLCPLGLLA